MTHAFRHSVRRAKSVRKDKTVGPRSFHAPKQKVPTHPQSNMFSGREIFWGATACNA
jgi:hypothetical protein